MSHNPAMNARAATLAVALLAVVTGSASAAKPTAFYTHAPGAPAVGLPVQFTDTSEGNPTSWLWDFDDGETSTEQNPSHVFDAAGSYNVYLTVSNSDGEDPTYQIVVVTEDPIAPAVEISHQPDLPTVGQPVQFHGYSFLGPATSWEWDFGDGGTSTEQNPTYVFAEEGAFPIQLTASNSAGTDTATELVTVMEQDFAIETSYLIPAASLAGGAEGSFFVTDVEVNNWTDEAARFRFLWLPRGADNSIPIGGNSIYTWSPGVSGRFENVLEDQFDLEPDVNGAVGIISDNDGLVVFARIYNREGQAPGEQSTFGQAVPGVPVSQLIGQGEVARIIFMTEGPRFRANIGCANGADESVRIFIDLYNDGGTLLETKTLDLAPWSNDQLNRIFRDYASINGHVDVRSDTPGAAYYCYGSVLDNTSNDPTTVEPALQQ